MENDFSLLKEFTTIPANQLVRGWPPRWRSLSVWALLAAVTILMSCVLSPFFIVLAVPTSLACVLWLAGYRLYRKWRRQLVASACPACATTIGPETAAMAFSDRARECREFMEGAGKNAFIDFGPVEALYFRCPSCSSLLCFSCHGPGEISLEDEEEMENPEDF